MMVKGPDGKMIECEIVATREHESIFMKNAPTLPLPLAIICCILNIIPGKHILEYSIFRAVVQLENFP